jgi:pimeloyl-ACP methyl ester carboxylesterase
MSPAVLLHGLTADGGCWAPVARALPDEFDIVLPDARGHGPSSAPLHGYQYEDYAGDILGLIRGLELARPALIGHSMGGMTAAVAANRAPGAIRALVLVDPTFLSAERQLEVRDSDVVDQHRRALGSQKSELIAQARARHPHRSSEIVELLAEARLRTQVQSFDVLTPPNPDYREVMSGMDIPILLVIGDHNRVVTLDTARELQLLNSRVQIQQVEGAGHGLPYDRPERLAEVIASFLRQ